MIEKPLLAFSGKEGKKSSHDMVLMIKIKIINKRRNMTVNISLLLANPFCQHPAIFPASNPAVQSQEETSRENSSLGPFSAWKV